MTGRTAKFWSPAAIVAGLLLSAGAARAVEVLEPDPLFVVQDGDTRELEVGAPNTIGIGYDDVVYYIADFWYVNQAGQWVRGQASGWHAAVWFGNFRWDAARGAWATDCGRVGPVETCSAGEGFLVSPGTVAVTQWYTVRDARGNLTPWARTAWQITTVR